MDSELSITDIISCVPEIENLTVRFDEFNPLKVLGVTEGEIRHSNIISWLLNPKSNHGFGSHFFKSFIRTVLVSSENESNESASDFLKKIILGDYTDIQVHRELSNIDIFCISEKNQIAIIIENKYNSGEHSDQLARYLSRAKSQYRDFTVIPILLSLEGLKPSQSEYFAASYQQILDSIEQVFEIFNRRIPIPIHDFIKYYQTIIKEKIMGDQALQDIARRIYKDNKTAIDFIYSVGNAIDISIAGKKFSEKRDNLKVIWGNPLWFSFVDVDFIIKNKMKHQWAGGNPVQYWIQPVDNKLKIGIEVGPFDSGNDRLSFLLEIERAGCKLRPSSKTETGVFTRLYTTTIDIKDFHDNDELEEKIRILYENTELRKIADFLKEAIKSHSSFW